MKNNKKNWDLVRLLTVEAQEDPPLNLLPHPAILPHKSLLKGYPRIIPHGLLPCWIWRTPEKYPGSWKCPGSQPTIQTTTETTGHPITPSTYNQITHIRNNIETNVDLRTGTFGFS